MGPRQLQAFSSLFKTKQSLPWNRLESSVQGIERWCVQACARVSKALSFPSQACRRPTLHRHTRYWEA